MLMLRHLGERDAADRLEQAIAAVIARASRLTYDMKPTPRRSDRRRHEPGRRRDHREGTPGLLPAASIIRKRTRV
jgi:hypothetical protein